MAREEVGKQRIHIDLVGSTNMGTTMVKGFGKKDISKGKSKTKMSKVQDKKVARNKVVKNLSKDKEAAKGKNGKNPLPPKKKP
tara:strand:+ start:478 stop:726 length:249 start_codon:yes stop_codon:yes gene_type:complete